MCKSHVHPRELGRLRLRPRGAEPLVISRVEESRSELNRTSCRGALALIISMDRWEESEARP